MSARAIHSYADARRLARRRLPWMVFDYIDGAAGNGVAEARNLAALGASPLADLYQTFIEFHGAQAGRENDSREDLRKPALAGAKTQRSVS